MLFNSFEFALFLPLTFIIYWFITNRTLTSSNLFLLLASYTFYAFWDYRFLALIIFSSACDFFVGRAIAGAQNKTTRKRLLTVSLIVNLGMLGVFKYYGFFVSEFIQLFGWDASSTFNSLQIILPVGISFYTFQTLSYTIDVYRGRLKPTSDWLAFFAFVSFFPQLVAGPIERATNLLPQFLRARKFSYYKAGDGVRQILWGLFKKVVIADNAAIYVEDIFGKVDQFGSGGLVLGLFLFAIQIYCDFSGYSDIAIGTARLFGFNLMKNFAFPYFSRDIGEFWRRWHISLSTWFRDYVYIPLGGSRVKSKKMLVRNVMVVFLVSGLWHGANWTFLAWGFLHACYFIPAILSGRNRRYRKSDANLSDLLNMFITFSLVCLAWTFFRAEDLSHALQYFEQMFTQWSLDLRIYRKAVWMLLGVVALVLLEWLQRDKEHAFQLVESNVPRPVRALAYLATAMTIILCAPAQQTSFIYFQF